MKRILLTGFLLTTVFMVGSGWARTDPWRDHTILVVPSQYTPIRYGFDIARLRPVTLVSYQRHPRTDAIVLFVWDKYKRGWRQATMGEYESGEAFDVIPAHTVLVGNDAELLDDLEQATRVGDVTRVGAFNLVTLTNALDKQMRFSAAEWKWLASRYRLKLQDVNEERRRYGKYGPPEATQRRVRPVYQDRTMTSRPEPIAPEKAGEETESNAPLPIQEAPAVETAPARTSTTIMVIPPREPAPAPNAYSPADK